MIIELNGYIIVDKFFNLLKEVEGIVIDFWKYCGY